MTLRARATLVYLVLTLMLGGSSSGGLWANLAVQMLGAGLIAWTWPDRRPMDPLLRVAFLAFAGVAALQFLPLPPSIWPSLPGRQSVAAGFAALDVPLVWQTWSLSPEDSLYSLVGFLPALALYLASRAAHAPSPTAIARTIVSVALLSIPLSLIQRFAGKLYLYTITNYGLGPGFFANSNHQGDLLLIALALGTGLRAGRHREQTGMLAALAIVLIAGILLNHSLAGVGLLAIEGTVLALLFAPRRIGPIAATGLLLVAMAAIAGLLLWFGTNDLTGGTREVGISRRDFLVHGLQALRATFPAGSGIGTFPDLYRWYEDQRISDGTFANHAHDDLLEWLIETGLPGALALSLGLAWLGKAAVRLARADTRGISAAAGIAILVLLLHSLVDYPLRTAAVSGLLAVCCALLERSADDRETADQPMKSAGN